VISEDISDFVYAPTADYETDIFVYNEPDERSLLMRFLEHIKEVKPFIITTFNGDKFDWPFIQRRMEKTNICMFDEIGVYDHEGEFYGRYMVH
jgi:DNA polymerase epsilon subunit 1